MKHQPLGLAAGSLLVFPASGALIANNPFLPADGPYVSPIDAHAQFSGPGLVALLLQPEHIPFAGGAIRFDDGSGNEIEEFDSTLTGISRVLQSPVGPAPDAPFTLTGPVQTIVSGKTGNTTGTFDTEILSMDLTGTINLTIIQVPVLIRESPSLQSTGQTTITDIGGGQFRIDSFFDVFTELSIDNGVNWVPTVGSTRMVLVPEPSASLLAAIGLLMFLRKRRR